MNKTFARFLCLFIPSRRMRKKIREKANKKPSELAELRTQIKALRAVIDATIDMGALPRANGFTRTFQLLNLEIMEEFDRVCRKHGLRYWLSFGSALGAVRHRGYIPWDDDIDLCMMYEDWVKFKELSQTELAADFDYIELPGDIGRMVRKDFMPSTEAELMGFTRWHKQPRLFFGIDVFPVYWLSDAVSESEASVHIAAEREAKRKKCRSREFRAETWQQIQRETDEALSPIIGSPGCKNVFASLHSLHPVPRIWASEDIFPLREAEFEGRRFYIARHAEYLLFKQFGNYMQPVMSHTHLSLNHVQREDLLRLIEHGKRLGSL